MPFRFKRAISGDGFGEPLQRAYCGARVKMGLQNMPDGMGL